MTKYNEVIAEKPFQNSGVTKRLRTLGHRCQYILLVIHAEHVVHSAWILFWLWMYVCMFVC